MFLNKEAIEMESSRIKTTCIVIIMVLIYTSTTHIYTHSGVVGSEDSTTFKPNLGDKTQEEGFVNPLHA